MFNESFWGLMLDAGSLICTSTWILITNLYFYFNCIKNIFLWFFIFECPYKPHISFEILISFSSNFYLGFLPWILTSIFFIQLLLRIFLLNLCLFIQKSNFHLGFFILDFTSTLSIQALQLCWILSIMLGYV